MAGTFTGSLDRTGEWLFWFTMAGIGRRIGAITPALRTQTHFTTQHPYRYGYTAADSDHFLTALMPKIRSVGESIDLRKGSTRLGTMELNLSFPSFWNYDDARTDQGWGADPLTNMMAVFGPVHPTHTVANGEWVLSAAITAATTSIPLTAVDGIAVGDALWLESEVVICTATPGGTGAGTITGVRAQYGTTAVAHEVTGPRAEGILYDRPKFLRGRDIKLYAQLFEKGKFTAATHAFAGSKALLPVGEAREIWSGTLDDWEYPAGGPLRFACRPDLGKLNRTLGRDCIHSMTVEAPDADGYESLIVTMEDTATYAGESASFDYPVVDDEKTFYARLGDELVYCSSGAVDGDTLWVTLLKRGLLGTEQADLSKSLKFHDVLYAGQEGVNLFTDSNGDATSHPIDLILSMVTSTGTYDGETPGSGGNGDWDVLPANWGVGYPVTSINLQSFINLKYRSWGASFDRLLMNWEGKPVPLRDFITKEILGPMGWFIYIGVGEDGGLGLSIGSIGDQYPKEVVATLEEGDIIQGSWQMQGQLRQTLSTQTFSFQYDLGEDTFQQVRVLRRPEVLARYPHDDSEISYEVPGVTVDGNSASTIEGRSNNFGDWFATPLPLVAFTTRLSRIEVSVTEKVLLTMPDVLNPFTGERGFTNRAAIVLSALPAFSSGNRNGIAMTCMLIPERNTGLWSPAGVIRDYDSATQVYTLETNEFTEVTGAGAIPIRDTLAFNLSDEVQLINRWGERRSIVSQTVAVAPETDGANTLRLSAAFTGVAPQAGDRLIYSHYSPSAAIRPRDAWTDDMEDTAAMAYVTTGKLPNGDAAYQMGN